LKHQALDWLAKERKDAVAENEDCVATKEMKEAGAEPSQDASAAGAADSEAEEEKVEESAEEEEETGDASEEMGCDIDGWRYYSFCLVKWGDSCLLSW
jgi:hypothetical protein